LFTTVSLQNISLQSGHYSKLDSLLLASKKKHIYA